MEIPNTPYGKIERLEEGNYPDLLLEISAYMLTLPRRRVEQHGIDEVLGLLNRSYNLFGEGSVSSQLAWEVSKIPEELDDPNPMFRDGELVRTINGGFKHLGYGYGFNYFESEQAVVISFTDNHNPFQVVNLDGPPEVVKTYHIPVMMPHSVSMMNGYQIESA